MYFTHNDLMYAIHKPAFLTLEDVKCWLNTDCNNSIIKITSPVQDIKCFDMIIDNLDCHASHIITELIKDGYNVLMKKIYIEHFGWSIVYYIPRWYFIAEAIGKHGTYVERIFNCLDDAKKWIDENLYSYKNIGIQDLKIRRIQTDLKKD